MQHNSVSRKMCCLSLQEYIEATVLWLHPSMLSMNSCAVRWPSGHRSMITHGLCLLTYHQPTRNEMDMWVNKSWYHKSATQIHNLCFCADDCKLFQKNKSWIRETMSNEKVNHFSRGCITAVVPCLHETIRGDESAMRLVNQKQCQAFKLQVTDLNLTGVANLGNLAMNNCHEFCPGLPRVSCPNCSVHIHNICSLVFLPSQGLRQIFLQAQISIWVQQPCTYNF